MRNTNEPIQQVFDKERVEYVKRAGQMPGQMKEFKKVKSILKKIARGNEPRALSIGEVAVTDKMTATGKYCAYVPIVPRI